MSVLSGFSHRHVTEREGAHTHPNGAFDDASWEDCTFMAAIEWWRASGHPEVPATHAEGEAMRDASGIPTTGGSTIADVRRGIAARYGSPTWPPIAGSARVWAAMVPGSVGLIQGSMAAFPNGSPWRRWDPAFNGAHAICAFRPDATDRVWWCDPLAPENGYAGEWMTKAEFTAYIDGLAGYSLVSQVVPDKTTGGDARMPAYKPVGRPIGSFTFSDNTHALIVTTDTRKHIPFGGWPGGGDTFPVFDIIDLKTPSGTAVDIEGTSPPLNKRDQVYLVDRPEWGAACFVLRGDGTFTPAAGPAAPDLAAIETARKEAADAATTTERARVRAIAAAAIGKLGEV